MSETNNLYIGIDPGKNGGVALLSNEGDYYRALAFRCPDADNMHKVLLEHIEEFCIDFDSIYVGIENVWAFPTDARSSAFKFGFNTGMWKGIISAMFLDTESIPPKVWMTYYGMPKNLEKQKN